MSPTERIIAVIDGNELDTVQTFSVLLDDHPIQQVLGEPFIKDTTLLLNPVSRLFLDRWGVRISRFLVPLLLDDLFMRAIEASLQLGFDGVWGYFVPSLIIRDSKTLIDVWGSYHNLIDDGHGNLYYMYREPAIPTPEAYEAWPYFPDPDVWAHRTYEFFKKALARFGDRICIAGEVPTDIYDGIQNSMGFQNISIAIRRNPEFICRWIVRMEDVAIKTTMAMMDAGIKVVLKGDDFGFKTGPQMNPKVFDEFFGPSYTRLTKAVHDRGGRILLHSCGDNTKMFDCFIKWGFDGGHAFETTSNVNIPYEKKMHGDRFTIVGGIGVDYLLTERSRREEVEQATREILDICAPGGRFLLAPVHSHPALDMSKVRAMIETARNHRLR
jgi:uroporphyrinogen decarboxylase